MFGLWPDWQPLDPGSPPPNAFYPRPKGASPIRASLVPAYQECAESGANRTHGPPLGFASCSPHTRGSQRLTVGTPDSNGAAVRSTGSVTLKVLIGSAPTPDDTSDVATKVTITDVRNAGDLTDYAGELEVALTARLTDRHNQPGAGSQTAATVEEEISLFITVLCTPTAATDVGSTCSVDTTIDSFYPGAVRRPGPERSGSWAR